MDLNDLNKVWEIKPLNKIGEDEARKILKKVAKQVQPIMRKRKWKVKILSEFWYGLQHLLPFGIKFFIFIALIQNFKFVVHPIHLFWAWTSEEVLRLSWGCGGQIGTGISFLVNRYLILCFMSSATMNMDLTMLIFTDFWMKSERCIFLLLHLSNLIVMLIK